MVRWVIDTYDSLLMHNLNLASSEYNLLDRTKKTHGFESVCSNPCISTTFLYKTSNFLSLQMCRFGAYIFGFQISERGTTNQLQ